MSPGTGNGVDLIEVGEAYLGVAWLFKLEEMPEMDPDYGKYLGPESTAFLTMRLPQTLPSVEIRFFFVFKEQALIAFYAPCNERIVPCLNECYSVEEVSIN